MAHAINVYERKEGEQLQYLKVINFLSNYQQLYLFQQCYYFAS